jgi:hypothetical protein
MHFPALCHARNDTHLAFRVLSEDAKCFSLSHPETDSRLISAGEPSLPNRMDRKNNGLQTIPEDREDGE